MGGSVSTSLSAEEENERANKLVVLSWNIDGLHKGKLERCEVICETINRFVFRDLQIIEAFFGFY